MSTIARILGGKRPLLLCEGPQKKQQRALPAHAAFFADPKAARPLSANASVDITEGFDDDMVPRAWTGADGKRPVLTYLGTSQPQFEAMLLTDHAFLCGLHDPDQAVNLKDFNLEELSKGGFNQLWAGKMTPASRRILPPDIANLVQEDKLVVRGPLPNTDSRTRHDVISEINNVLHAAVHGYGPLVAGITWVRTWHKNFEEGAVHVNYRLVTFMEKGTKSVYGRIKEVERAGVPSAKHAFATRQGLEQYFDSLLRCVHAYSLDRFVYMDATLSNFVDFCGKSAPQPARIRVIDIGADVFRRVLPPLSSKAPAPSRAWQLLWLHNTLYVTCFLKRQLAGLSGLGGVNVARAPGSAAGSGQHAFDVHWWGKIRGAVAEMRRLLGAPLTTDEAAADDDELERCRAFLSKARRPKEVPIEDLWQFPYVDQPPYVGTTSLALAKSAFAYFYYYFVHQPLKDIKAAYLVPALKLAELRAQPHMNVHPNARAEAEEEHRKGAEWFDAVARRTLIPTVRFFQHRFASADGPDGGSALLVDIMIEYASTPQDALEARFLGPRVLTSKQHTHHDLQNLLPTLLATH
jgi:hypothetical protein